MPKFYKVTGLGNRTNIHIRKGYNIFVHPRTLQKLGKNLYKAEVFCNYELRTEIRKIMEEIMKESEQLVPVDTGFLQGSQFIIGPQYNRRSRPLFTPNKKYRWVDVDKFRRLVELYERKGATAYAGGYQAGHAVPVHERTDLKHDVGRDHFLYIPFMKAKTTMYPRMAKAIRKGLLKARATA